MAMWEVRGWRRNRVYRAERVRRRVARGHLDGDTQVRPLGCSEWRPIREVEELRPGAAPDVRARRWEALQGLLTHAAVYAGVNLFIGLPRVAMLGWGFALFMHALGTLQRLFAPAEGRPADSTRTQRDPQPAAAPAREREPDPFLDELGAALGDLERVAATRRLEDVDLAALRSAAEQLRARHLTLVGLSDPAALARLTEERDRALSRAAAARDPRTIEALKVQAGSVSERLEALQEAGEAAARLEARERTLLHQVEALRLALARSGADEAVAPDLAAEVRRLQLDVKASAEVEVHLARARLGAEPQRS